MKIIDKLIRTLFVFIFFAVIFHPSLVLATLPCSCNSSSSCYADGCTRKTIKSDGTIDYGLCGSAGCNDAYSACYQAGDVEHTGIGPYFCVQQPPCCKDMVERNDPEACCWPERGFCHPFFCSKVSRPEKCGWYWTFHDGVTNRPDGYGCMKGPDANSLTPNFGLPAGVPGGGGQPTSVPPTVKPTQYIPPTVRPTQYIPPNIPPTRIPTQYSAPLPTSNAPHQTVPTAAPTNFNIVAPTQYIPPEFGSVVNPTATPPDTTSVSFPIFSLPPISFPSFAFPAINTEPIKISARNTIIQSEKVLVIPAQAAEKIGQLDKGLELLISTLIMNLINAVIRK